MKINTGSLPLGTREFTFVEDAETVGLDERFTGEVRVLARVEKTGKMLDLQATTEVAAALACDRCAERFTRNLVAHYHVVYFFREADRSGHPDDAIVVLPSENTVIDITDDVRQYVLLTMPLKVLCSDMCRGLCPSCGTNLNSSTCSCTAAAADPRWEQLNKLLKNN
jgi:uncharacterized protein